MGQRKHFAIGIAALAAMLLTAAGCEPGMGAAALSCPTACLTGQMCDPSSGVCVPNPAFNPNPNPNPNQNQFPNPNAGPTCNAPMQTCGARCVDFQSDPLNCGGCGVTCGTNAVCSFGQCQCTGQTKNCNGVFTDGCECPGACDTAKPAQCGGGGQPQGKCNPSQANSCNSGMYCDNSSGTATCVACPTGFNNCDGVWACECKGSCNGNQCGGGTQGCDPGAVSSCGSAGAFCDQATKQCAACKTGYSNCDGQWGCECQGSCQGKQCSSNNSSNGGTKCLTSQYNACGDHSWYCDPGSGRCKECTSGLFGLGAKSNCDGVGGCETSGTSCNNSRTCDPSAYNPCGDSFWFCDASTRLCTRCGGGSKNCDLRGSCELSSGTCSGGGQGCKYTQWACGSGNTGQYCHSSTLKCQTCLAGRYNCDGWNNNGCESSTRCGSSGGQTCDWLTTWPCGTRNYGKYCSTSRNACTSCPTGRYNCNDLNSDGCESSTPCGGGSTTGARWDFQITRIVATATKGGTNWDTRSGDPPPDIFAVVGVVGGTTKTTSTVLNSTTASWPSSQFNPILTNVSESDLRTKGVRVKVRDNDYTYGYETIGECTIKLSQYQTSTHYRTQACGLYVRSIEVKLIKR